jgi:hypothetical protein
MVSNSFCFITVFLADGISNNLAQMFNIMRWCVMGKNRVVRPKVKVIRKNMVCTLTISLAGGI